MCRRICDNLHHGNAQRYHIDLSVFLGKSFSCSDSIMEEFSVNIFVSHQIYVMFCAIWYHLYSLKNVKNTHGGVLLLVKLQGFSCRIKVTLFHGCFPRFLNCTNNIKSCNASHMYSCKNTD